MNLLFLCTGNACRSQMAEGWAKQLAPAGWHIDSAGIEAHGKNPRAIAVMAVPHNANGSTISNQRLGGAMGEEEDALFKIRGIAVAKDDLALAP